MATLQLLGFHLVRRGNHISMSRQNSDGTNTPLTILTQSKIARDEFLDAYEKV